MRPYPRKTPPLLPAQGPVKLDISTATLVPALKRQRRNDNDHVQIIPKPPCSTMALLIRWRYRASKIGLRWPGDGVGRCSQRGVFTSDIYIHSAALQQQRTRQPGTGTKTAKTDRRTGLDHLINQNSPSTTLPTSSRKQLFFPLSLHSLVVPHHSSGNAMPGGGRNNRPGDSNCQKVAVLQFYCR